MFRKTPRLDLGLRYSDLGYDGAFSIVQLCSPVPLNVLANFASVTVATIAVPLWLVRLMAPATFCWSWSPCRLSFW